MYFTLGMPTHRVSLDCAPEQVSPFPFANGRYFLRDSMMWGRYDEADLEQKRFLMGARRLMSKIATREVDVYSDFKGRWLRDVKEYNWHGFHALQWCRDDPEHHWLEGWSQTTRDWKFPEGLKWYDPPYGTADDDLSHWP